MAEVEAPAARPDAGGPDTIYTVGGAVQASQGLYLPRPADEELLALCRAGTFAYVLSPRQLGKSSLMIQTARRLAAAGTRAVLLDLTAIGTGVTAEDWYFGLLYEIADQLALTTDLPDWWAARAALGLTQRFTLFFKEVVLAEVAEPVVIFVDEIDTTLSLPFTDDFFAAIRAFHDARARVAPFRRLSFVLIGVATPGDLIHDAKRTPFNVGQRVEMADFTLEEAAPLGAGLGLPPAAAGAVLREVFAWTGGHPYLTQRLCQALTADGPAPVDAARVAAVVRRLFFGEESGQDNNIQFVRDMLTKRAPDPVAVLTVYRAVRQERAPVPDEERSLVKSHLKLAGVVQREHGVLRVRNRIYRAVFDDRWVRDHLPGTIPWVTWLRRALAVLAVLFFVSVTGLGLYAEARRQEAETARTLAQARELAIRAQTAPDPETGLLLAIAAARDIEDGQVADANGQIARVLSEALAGSHVRLRLATPAPVTSARWSPDGRSILTAGADGLVRVWDLAAVPGARALSTPRLVLRGHAGAVLDAAWSPDGRQIVTAGADGTARIWDAAGGRELAALRGHSAEVVSAAWSPDGKAIVTASRDNTARVWDAVGGPARLVLRGHTGWVRDAAWSPDGGEIVTASADTTAKIWDAAHGRERRTLSGHIRDVRGAAWSPDGKLIVTASEDTTAKIWDAAGGQEQLTLRGHAAAVAGAAWSPDGRQILTAGADGSARVWDAAAGREQTALLGHTGEVTRAAWSPDGQQVVTAGADGTARIWTTSAAPARLVLNVDPQGVAALTWSPDGRQLATSTAGGTVQIWDAGSGQPLGTLPGHPAGGHALAWSADGRSLLTGGADGTVTVWAAAGGPARLALQGPAAGIAAAAWSPDGDAILAAGADGTVTIWDAASRQVRLAWHDPAGALLAAAWRPDGRAVATAGRDKLARIWDITAPAGPGTPRLVLAGHSDDVTGVAWSPDGRSLLTAGADGTARIWDAARGGERLALRGHADAVNAAAWSPDGRQIVTAGADGTARVWDATSGGERLTLRGHTGPVLVAAWSPDGRDVVTAGADGTARRYPVDLAGLLALAATRVTRPLTPAEAEQLGIPPTATSVPLPGTALMAAATPTPGAAGGVLIPTAPATGTTAPAAPAGSPAPPLSPLPAPFGRIAFASNRGYPASSHIYLMRPDGAEERPLTVAPLDNLYPDWSPDGTRLVYMAASPRGASSSPAGDLFIMNADGSGRFQLTHGLNAKWPKWSPDGSTILYADGPENHAPAYDLYLITLKDQAIRRLTENPGFDGYPAWTPDGRIVFTSARLDNRTHLFTMNADGSNVQQLTAGTGEEQGPSVSPDGSRIAFSAIVDGAEHLYTVARDGAQPQQITFGPGPDRYPAWSPDGRWIAFHSNRDDHGNFAVYLVPASGGAVRRLTLSGGDDDEPAWHR